ncbi:MAG: hypothetical protein AAGF32_02975 [Pseudomonadota bacterium]
MFFLRMFGGWFLVAAIITMVFDGTMSVGSADGWITTSLASLWAMIHPASLDSVSQLSAGSTVEQLLARAIGGLIGLPAFAWFLAIGALLFAAGRPKRSVEVFAN